MMLGALGEALQGLVKVFGVAAGADGNQGQETGIVRCIRAGARFKKAAHLSECVVKDIG